MLTRNQKLKLYKELETYRMWHGWTQEQFISTTISYSSYAKMKNVDNSVNEKYYIDLLQQYGFYTIKFFIDSIINEKITSLYDAFGRYDLETSLEQIKQIEYLLSMQNDTIQSMNLYLFFHELNKYVQTYNYLSEY